MAQRGAGFVLGGTNHGAVLSTIHRLHGDEITLPLRMKIDMAMDAMENNEATATMALETYKLHRLGFGPDWVLVWFPEVVPDYWMPCPDSPEMFAKMAAA